MGSAVKQLGRREREAKGTSMSLRTPSMSERNGFRKRNMSASGQKRQFGDFSITSALPLKADIHRKGRHVSNVPEAVMSECTLDWH
jgi:hypothetical protein